jgi:hypothetical protein
MRTPLQASGTMQGLLRALRVKTAVAMAGVVVLGASFVSVAEAKTSCAYAGPPANVLTVKITEEGFGVIERKGLEVAASELHESPQPCAGGIPTVLNTDTIIVGLNGGNFVDVRLDGGRLTDATESAAVRSRQADHARDRRPWASVAVALDHGPAARAGRAGSPAPHDNTDLQAALSYQLSRFELDAAAELREGVCEDLTSLVTRRQACLRYLTASARTSTCASPSCVRSSTSTLAWKQHCKHSATCAAARRFPRRRFRQDNHNLALRRRRRPQHASVRLAAQIARPSLKLLKTGPAPPAQSWLRPPVFSATP